MPANPPATLLQPDQINRFREQGYLIVRRVFDTEAIERLRQGYTYVEELAGRPDLDPQYTTGKGPEVHIHIQAPAGAADAAATRYLRKIQWPAFLHPAFEAFRTSPIWPALLRPLIGDSLKQYINQINFKMPGGGIDFPWHQDIRPTPAFSDQVKTYVQSVTLVDAATVANGCLQIVPGSHRLGDLKAKRYAKGQIEEQVDVAQAVAVEGEPGDVVLFTPYTVHGSSPNTTDSPRRSYINGFVRAAACTVGKWAFLAGKPVPLTGDHDYHAIRYTGTH